MAIVLNFTYFLSIIPRRTRCDKAFIYYRIFNSLYMSFVYPWFLWALLSLAIPIIIHLFYFRRYKTVYFTNVRFLKEVKEQTAARSRLKHLLTLVMRLGALAFLVLAFAMPYIPEKGSDVKAGARDVSIYFDNSFSMSAESEDVRLLEKARQRAEEIVAAYDAEDRIQILTADFEGRDQRLLSKDDAMTRVREVRPSFSSRMLSTVLARQKSALATGINPNKEIYIISDFQQNASDLAPNTDSMLNIHLVPLQSVQNRNVSIDTAWFASPVPALNQPNELIVRVRNHTDIEMPSVRLMLDLDGQTRPEGTLALPAKSAIYDTINVTVQKTGWHQAKINITDFPIEFDNDYFLTFYVAEQVAMLEIFDASPNRFVQASFGQNAYFKLTSQSVNQLDYSKFANYNLLILSEVKNIPSGLISELTAYIKNGGNVLIFPHAQAVIKDYNALAQALQTSEWGRWDAQAREVSFINFEDFVFNDVFEERRENLKLPATKGNFRIVRKASTAEEVLLRYRDGQTFVNKQVIDKGNLFMCASPLDAQYSNLVQNGEIFVPMLYRMALATGQTRKIAYTIGKDNFVETSNRVTTSELVYKIGGETGEFIPEQRTLGSRVVLGINNQIASANIYDLYFNKGETLEKYAFNYDRQESELAFWDVATLEKMTNSTMSIIEGSAAKDFTNLISTQNKGTPLWKWCLIATLAFLLGETLILRLIKG